MQRKICVLFAVALLTAFLTGCLTGRSVGAWETIYVRLQPSGSLTLEGKTMDVAGLAKRLKSMGATDQTCIEISIPEGTPTATLTAVTQTLASSGYRKILFVKPRRTDVELEGEAAARKIPAPK